MASFRRVGNKVLAEVRIKGKYLSRTFESKTEAKSWAADEEHKIKNAGDILHGKTLREAFDRYKVEECPKKKGARWEIIRLEKIGRDKIGNALLCDLEAIDFEKWIKRQRDGGLSDSSIRRELQLISAVLTKCRKWKWMDGNPLADVEQPKDAPHRELVYTDEQIERVCAALDYVEGQAIVSKRQHIAAAFILAIETAMRQGEIWGLEWGRIHLDRRHVHLPDTKNGAPRDVPLSRAAMTILEAIPRDSKRVFNFSQASAGVVFRRALQVAGIEGMTWHDTRHTATTRMAQKVDMLTLAKITGHKDPRMLMRYFNPTAHDIAQRLD